jgi:GNAT superfamily N-acetyltransferase
MVPSDQQTLIDIALKRMKAPESAIFGAFADTRLIGIVGVRRLEREKERHKASIWGMYVAASSRRHGAAGMLLREAIGRARSWLGLEQVQLAVTDAAPDARRIYERHGFRVWGVEPRALCWDGRAVDETYMILDLRDDPPA